MAEGEMSALKAFGSLTQPLAGRIKVYFSRDEAEGDSRRNGDRVEGRLGFSGLQNRTAGTSLYQKTPQALQPLPLASHIMFLCFHFHHSLCGSTF